jgi:CRISPR/Cas system CMR-associated protein Cmr5 small subunit
MNSFLSFPELLSVVLSGVVAHNGLQLVVTKLTQVATAVDQGDVRSLTHDAHGVADYVATHDPALAKAVGSEVDKLKKSAEDEINAAKHAAATEIRKLASALEGIEAPAVAPAEPAPAPTAPAEPATPVS